MSFDSGMSRKIELFMSQSLWNRAMSFDAEECVRHDHPFCLNPFGTGQCLSTLDETDIQALLLGLNPFGTGQCLSTS